MASLAIIVGAFVFIGLLYWLFEAVGVFPDKAGKGSDAVPMDIGGDGGGGDGS